MKKKSQPKFPLARVKKIVQTNKEIGKISHSIPFLISKSLEMFLTDLLNSSIDVAKDYKKNKITGSCLKKVIEEQENLSFLNKIVEEIPPIDTEKVSRQRSKTSRKKKELDRENEDDDEDDPYKEEDEDDSEEAKEAKEPKLRKKRKLASKKEATILDDQEDSEDSE